MTICASLRRRGVGVDGAAPLNAMPARHLAGRPVFTSFVVSAGPSGKCSGLPDARSSCRGRKLAVARLSTQWAAARLGRAVDRELRLGLFSSCWAVSEEVFLSP